MKLFCNGFNLFGQFDVNKPILEELIPVYNDIDIINIKQVFLNFSYNLIVTEKGLFVFHNGKKLKLDLKFEITDCNNDEIIFYNESKYYTCYLEDFTKILKLDILNTDEPVLIIKISTKMLIIYLSNGDLYNKSYKLNFNCKNIKEIKCGREHCLILDNFGNIYSFGNGSRGQLGHGKLDGEVNPKQIEALAGIKIKKIATGDWHSCALSIDGDLYVWGWNSNGQLGLGKEEDDDNFFSVMASPHPIDFPIEDLNAVSVACGSRHTVIFFDNKKLYGCGWNKYHQLTKEKQENYFKLTYIHDFSDENVADVFCGPWNSAVLCQ